MRQLLIFNIPMRMSSVKKLVKVGEIPLMKSRVSRGKNFLKPKENHKIEISLVR